MEITIDYSEHNKYMYLLQLIFFNSICFLIYFFLQNMTLTRYFTPKTKQKIFIVRKICFVLYATFRVFVLFNSE